MLDLIVSCGELSGDLALAQLLQSSLKWLKPERVGGVLGPELEKLGFRKMRSLEGLQVMGFGAVLASAKTLRRHMRELIAYIMLHNPPVVICSDYPGFHLSLASRLRKAGYKGRLIQLICPSIWAWKPWRIRKLEAYFNEVWGILPFEAPLFQYSPISYKYVGNPSFERALQDSLFEEAASHLDQGPSDYRSHLGLFPGSRPQEIKRHLPHLLIAAHHIDQQMGPQNWKIFLADEDSKSFIEEKLQGYHLQIEWVLPSHRMESMKSLRSAMAVSGTVCLELALHRVPYVAIYETGWLSYLVAVYLLRLRLKAYTLPNIILNRLAFAEIMGPRLDDTTLAKTFADSLQSPKSDLAKKALQELWEQMSTAENSSQRTMAVDLLKKWIQTDRELLP